MPSLYTVNVRSHRRGGRRQPLAVAPWIVITVVSVLVLSGMSAGYAWLATSGCSGNPVTATIVASPDVSQILSSLGRRWAETQPAIRGQCAAVEVVAKDSATVAATLGDDWNPRSSGPRPDVWVPDAAAWLRKAASRDDAARMIPDRQPSLARTPAVIAMPMPMAKALQWPRTPMTWRGLVTGYAGKPWSGYGKPDWGKFQIGMTDPATSSAGLLALTAVADGDNDGEVTTEERDSLRSLRNALAVQAETTDVILGEITKRDADGEARVLSYLSAFPALERDLLAYNETNPNVPLAAVYPTDGSADADHPYLVLNAPWTSKDKQGVANAFRDFIRGSEGRQLFLDSGFRDANRSPGRGLTASNGFQPDIATLPRAVMVPESVDLTVAAWRAATRRSNVLLVLDVSKSMAAPVEGTEKRRLDILREAALTGISMFSTQSRLGLWRFASRLDGGSDHREEVPLGPVDEQRERLNSELDKLRTGDGAGLYGTALAAYQAVEKKFVPGAVNYVVLVSGAKDHGKGLPLAQLRDQLSRIHDDARPVRMITVAYGPEADVAALQEISRLTGGQTLIARNPLDLDETLINALFS